MGCQATATDAQCNQPVELRSTATSPRAGRSPTTTRTTRRPTSRRRPPTRARPSRSSSASRPATRTATSTRSRSSTTRPSRSTAWEPQDGWNHKLLITHGASCGIDHQAGSAPDVENDAALSRGFAVMSTALNNAGHNCNIVTQAESMVMAKERLVEQYGELRYTIGTGCSGGSLTQQQVANAYPGIYQGILPACSFPDAWSTGQQLVDYHLVRGYVENPTKWGTGVALDARRDRRGRGPPQPRELDRLRHRLLDVAGRAGRRLPRRPGRAELQRRRPIRAACAARSRTT